jgi:hypothetical protein
MVSLKKLAKILEKGGATLSKNGKLANFKKGFQVSTVDKYQIKLSNINEILQAVNGLFVGLADGEYVGLWVDAGLVYVDISKKYQSFDYAMAIAKIYDQLSIYDWGLGACHDVKTFYSKF